MRMLIGDFAALTGVSVRTLRYYDEIGLMKPAEVEEHSGYRWYDGESLARMQEILFYRELDFPLQSIHDMLSSPEYDRRRALEEQRRLLMLKKERLERLIDAVDAAVKGENVMGAFDNREYEQYKDEVKQRWGGTDAYAEYQEKAGKRSDKQNKDMLAGMEDIFAAFADCMKSGETAESETARKLVRRLQEYITDNFYTCTDAILLGLGQMYTADERFMRNIDAHGEGTAQFVCEAIFCCCK